MRLVCMQWNVTRRVTRGRDIVVALTLVGIVCEVSIRATSASNNTLVGAAADDLSTLQGDYTRPPGQPVSVCGRLHNGSQIYPLAYDGTTRIRQAEGAVTIQNQSAITRTFPLEASDAEPDAFGARWDGHTLRIKWIDRRPFTSILAGRDDRSSMLVLTETYSRRDADTLEFSLTSADASDTSTTMAISFPLWSTRSTRTAGERKPTVRRCD